MKKNKFKKRNSGRAFLKMLFLIYGEVNNYDIQMKVMGQGQDEIEVSPKYGFT